MLAASTARIGRAGGERGEAMIGGAAESSAAGRPPLAGRATRGIEKLRHRGAAAHASSRTRRAQRGRIVRCHTIRPRVGAGSGGRRGEQQRQRGERDGTETAPRRWAKSTAMSAPCGLDGGRVSDAPSKPRRRCRAERVARAREPVGAGGETARRQEAPSSRRRLGGPSKESRCVSRATRTSDAGERGRGPLLETGGLLREHDEAGGERDEDEGPRQPSHARLPAERRWTVGVAGDEEKAGASNEQDRRREIDPAGEKPELTHSSRSSPSPAFQSAPRPRPSS